MTRRKIVFNNLDGRYLVSEEYNGDKEEMERFGLAACDHTWAEFMEAMNSVRTMPDFLKMISQIAASYHAVVNGTVLPQQANQLPGARIRTARSRKELYDLVGMMDEVWEVKRGTPGAHLLDKSSYAVQTYNGKAVWDESEFCFSSVKRGDYVSQAVVDDVADCLPPACYCKQCTQLGEPAATRINPNDNQAHSVFHTFRVVDGEWPDWIWEYCGLCFCGENVERGKSPTPLMPS